MESLAMFLILLGSLSAMGQTDVQRSEPVPVYRISVVGRSARVIDYRHGSDSTKIDFRGTALLSKAHGTAEVTSKKDGIDIDVKLKDLQPATKFGLEYLTYVLWAITPEGRAVNLGDILLNGTRSKLKVTTDLQAFGLIVTAEPYFAVSKPSDVVVIENEVRSDPVGTTEEVNAKYELLQKGHYVGNVNPAEVHPMVMDPTVPLELYEARNAVRIARWAGADRYAPDTFKAATDLLQQAEDYEAQSAGKKAVAMEAREAAQTAEDARVIAVKRMEKMVGRRR